VTTWGYTLSSEEHHPSDLVRNAGRAEALGFDYVSVSDHFHPWVSAQGQSPFVWSTVGAIAATTNRIKVGVGVTCPIMRIHPAVIAQAAATSAAMMPGRFFLGVGTGEALNEHIVGRRWPRIETRLEMLEEAVSIIRKLWKGDTVDHDGEHFTVDNARLFTVPPEATGVIVSAFGLKAAELAARIGDGMYTSGPAADVIRHFRDHGGTGPVIGQLTLCWDRDAATARRRAFEMWPNTAIPGQLSQDLPTPSHFEQACQLVTEDMIAESTPCGPDAGPIVDLVRKYQEAGVDEIHMHQIGPDQDGFFDFWERELASKIGADTTGAQVSTDSMAPGAAVLDLTSERVPEPNEPA
jgi:coenzyme F420-dependent glucose-6-phosphate dehydrogenase